VLAQQISNNPQWIKLLIIAIFAGSGLIRWIYVKLQEQAAKKRAMDMLEAGRVEELRTGRTVDASPEVERATPQQEAATRRQAQIEEFRRRQQERTAQRAGRGQATPARPKDAPKPAKRPSEPKRGPKRVVAAALTPEELEKEQSQGPRALLTPERPAAGPVVQAAFSRPGSPEDWRKVIVANTVLGKPPGLSSGGDSWSPLF
jgi:hypothetical protein